MSEAVPGSPDPASRPPDSRGDATSPQTWIAVALVAIAVVIGGAVFQRTTAVHDEDADEQVRETASDALEDLGVGAAGDD